MLLPVAHLVVSSAGWLYPTKKLSGVILEHDKFGSHLDAKGVTVNKDLELKNFDYTGRTIAEIWFGLVIDGNHVVVELIEDDHLLLWGRSQKSGKHVTFGNRNISNKLCIVQI